MLVVLKFQVNASISRLAIVVETPSRIGSGEVI
jgi:hypothetical protein